ncbi:leucine-rich_repeat domain-containing protein [Hexamita inflata]|uniref:Leucine-rich_repeat domain-containing protein n=1 Tax=Hexamita inflata TaxID=28002 RepID=A0ABP1HVW0_9EUKA
MQSKTPQVPETLSEYDNTMIKRYKYQIKNGELRIARSEVVQSLDFIQFLNIKKLVLGACENIIPKLQSQTIKQLQIYECDIFSVKDFQLENLEVLDITNMYGNQKPNKLTTEIAKFKKLKALHLHLSIDIPPLSQLINITKLVLKFCKLHSTTVLKPLSNLKELYMCDSQLIDITTLQYLTKLSNLTLICSLVNIDTLRPLVNLQQLIITKNQIIYIEPILEFKKLTWLNADQNKLIDVQTISLHSNIKNFTAQYVQNQYPPTQQEIKAANMMTDIQKQITILRKIRQQCKNFKQKQQRNVFRLKIKQSVQKLFKIQVSFVAKAASLFQQLNNFDQ